MNFPNGWDYDDEHQRDKPKRVIVLQGVSGSGKSTYARLLQSQAHKSGQTSVIVSADYFFSTPSGYVFDPTKLGEAHAKCFLDFIDGLQHTKDGDHFSTGIDLVIVDNTNSTLMEISPYMLGASAFGYEAKIVRVLCSPRLAYERGKHGVRHMLQWIQDARIRETVLPPWWNLEEVDGEASVTRMVNP